MKVATDEAGTVRLVGSQLPTDWNGMTLTIHELTPEQEAQYKALPEQRSGATFDGTEFVSLA